MQDYVHSGYYHIYKPPFSLTPGYNYSTIYCISSRLNNVFILMPLVPSFYKDAIEIAKNTPSRVIYIVAPDIGVGFASDYYNTWDYIKHKLRKECKIFSKYFIENRVTGEFESDIIRNQNDSLSIEIPRSQIDVGTINIEFMTNFIKAASPFSCDVLIEDTYNTKYFIQEMNIFKADFLMNNYDLFDEIHMPYISGYYGGLSYNEVLKKFPRLVPKLYCNQFGSREEYEYAKSRNVKIGGAYNNDFI